MNSGRKPNRRPNRIPGSKPDRKPYKKPGIRPTLHTWQPLYYGLAGFFLLAGLTTGDRPFFVLLLAQLLLALAALLANLYAALTFSFLQKIQSQQVVRGDITTLALQIHNEKPLPYPLLRIRLATPQNPEPQTLQFNLAPHSQRDFDLPLPCPYRGAYATGMTIIDFIDCFNLVRLPFDLRHLPYYRMQDLLVLPAYETAITLPGQSRVRSSEARLQRPSEDNTEPYTTVRPYRPGDSRRDIHWKASLRQQTLLTRQYGVAIEPQVLLILDFSRPTASGRLAWQAADAFCSTACTLLHHYLSQQIPVCLISNEGPHLVESRTAQTLQDFAPLRTWLGGMTFAAPVPLADLLCKSRGLLETARLVFLLTTCNDSPRIEPVLPLLIRQNRPDRPCQVILTLPEAVPSVQVSGVPGKVAPSGSTAGDNLFRQIGLDVLIRRYGQPWTSGVE